MKLAVMMVPVVLAHVGSGGLALLRGPATPAFCAFLVMAMPTAPMAVAQVVGVQVVASKRSATPRTAGLPSPLGSEICVASLKDMNAIGDQFEVGQVDAPAMLAGMVNLHSIGDQAVRLFIDESVGSHLNASNSRRDAISGDWIETTDPRPALVGAAFEITDRLLAASPNWTGIGPHKQAGNHRVHRGKDNAFPEAVPCL